MASESRDFIEVSSDVDSRLFFLFVYWFLEDARGWFGRLIATRANRVGIISTPHSSGNIRRAVTQTESECFSLRELECSSWRNHS